MHAAAAPQRALTPSFEDVPWGASKAAVRAALEGKGFAFRRADDDGDTSFTGRIDGEDVVAYEMFTPAGKLVSTQLSFLTDDDRALSFYADERARLAARYGAPSKNFAFWKSPASANDSERAHEEALRAGRGVFTAFWDYRDRGHVWLEISTVLAVVVRYENPDWSHELDRRRASHR